MSSLSLSYLYPEALRVQGGGMELEAQADRIIRAVERKFSLLERRLAAVETQRVPRYDNVQKRENMKDTTGYNPKEETDTSLRYQLAQRVTAIAGLKEAVTSENLWLRLVWTTLFVLGAGATMFYLYSTTEEYLKNPTATSTEMVIEDKYSFPPLLLCPQAWFDTEKALSLGMSMDALKYSLSYLDDFFPSQITNVTVARQEFLSVYNAHGFESLLEYYKAISNDFISGSELENASSLSTYWCRGCDPNEALGKTLLNHRFCYVFQLLPVEQLFGTYSAIRSINISFRHRTAGLTPYPSDWQVYFNKLNDSFIAIYPKVTVRPFHFNTIIVSTSKMITLDKPCAPCVHNTSEYCSVRCMTNCHNNMYRNYLNCKLLWLSFPSSQLPPSDICNFMDILPHNNWTLSEFFYSEQNTAIDSAAAEACVRECPRECERTTLDTTLQLKEKQSAADTKMVRATMGAELSQVETLTICVKHGAVYSGGVMVLTEKCTYSFTQLVNNIGGTLGLFVGATVMTFAQFVLFAVQYVFRAMDVMDKLGVGSYP